MADKQQRKRGGQSGAWERLARWLPMLLAILASSIVVQQHYSPLPCTKLTILDAVYADMTELRTVASLGMSASIDPALVSDRIQRHPWVRAARGWCYRNGVATVVVEERAPQLLVRDQQGAGAYYIDASGYRMPVLSGESFDVPLLAGLEEPYHPVRRVQDNTVRALARALARIDLETDALVSEIVLTPDGVRLYTGSATPSGTVEVLLGTSRVEEKLDRLAAFWRQAVASQPGKRFQLIDLRFDSQIITRESNDPSGSRS